MMRLGTALLLVFVGCSTEVASTNEVGITYRTVEDGLVAGTFETAYGSVDFTSAVTADGIVDVTFDRGGGAFGSHVDWTTLTNDLVAADDFAVTADDRFIMKALASTLENELGAGPASDNLIRQANLWGHHPEGAVLERRIEADPESTWTTLCNVGAYTFSHDASTHGLQSEYLSAGRYETSNPCRDRCGAGC
ncbi:MAG: hypothetical protein ABI175_18550, partial [Polyangiales bacterium]